MDSSCELSFGYSGLNVKSIHDYSGKRNNLSLLLKGFIGLGSVFWIGLEVTNMKLKSKEGSIDFPLMDSV